MRRSFETTRAVLLTSAALLVPSATAQAGDHAPARAGQEAEQHRLSKKASRVVTQVGGRIMRLVGQGKVDSSESSTSTNNHTELTVHFDNKRSRVARASGHYTMSITANLGRDHKLQPRDVGYIQMYEGETENNGPISSIRIYRDGHPTGNGQSWNVEGNTLNAAGRGTSFNGSTGSEVPEIFQLDEKDLQATQGRLNNIIDSAVSGQPTRPIAPPFGPVLLG